MRIANLMTGWPRGGPTTYHVEVNEVSLRNYLIARAYHWYDMRIPTKIPGWGRVEKWLEGHGAQITLAMDEPPKPRWRDRLLSWPIEQDIRCYELGHAKQKTLQVVKVTEAEYLAMGGVLHPRPSRPQKP